MPPDTAVHELPPLYSRWAFDLLGGLIPRETQATCDDCAMCVKEGGPQPTSLYFFDASLKCCVYMPELANFLVGRALSGDDPESAAGAGRESVRRRVRARIGVTPLGVGRPPSYDLVLRNSANTLGRSVSLRCPHYLEAEGSCGIWQSRDAMCTTWFCRHVRGRVGEAFWRALREVLVIVEGSLARRCALSLSVDPEVLSQWVPREGQPTLQRAPEGREVDGIADPARYSAIWGAWEGREEEYFVRCAEMVKGMSWADVLANGGPELDILARVARRAYERLISEETPARLKVGSFQIAAQRPGGVRAMTYSHLDAIDLPDALLAVLPLFDGRPTEVILADLAARGIGIEASYLRRLVDWGILIAEPGAAGPSAGAQAQETNEQTR